MHPIDPVHALLTDHSSNSSEHGANPEAKNEPGETPEEWGKRFNRDGPERITRVRRALLRKKQMKVQGNEEETWESDKYLVQMRELHAALREVVSELPFLRKRIVDT